MGRSLSSNTTVTFAIEETEVLGQSAIGTLSGSPTWITLEPNAINTFGSEITTTARDPISKSRQKRKGAVTDLDSAVEIDTDFTLSSFDNFVEGFVFATAVNSELKFVGGDATATGYTIPSASTQQADKLQFTSGGPISLVYARGYAVVANNGLKALTADVVSTDLEISVSGVSVEVAPTNAQVDIAGIRAEVGDIALAVSGTVGTLSSGNNGAVNNIDFTTLGWTVGHFVHLGGLLLANQLFEGAGFARITSIAAGTVLLDKMDVTLLTASGAGDTVDILFGKFIRNVDVDDPDFLTRSFQFEVGFDGLDTDDTRMWEYSKGNFCNQLALSLPLNDKSSMTPGFIGTDTEPPASTQKTNADTPIDPVATAAYDTVGNVVTLRITDVDESGLTTCFKDMTVTFNNNVAPEKCIGTLGAEFMNYGNFEINIETQILFTNALVVSRIRNNATVTMDLKLSNDDGMVVFDIPSMTMGGGGRDFNVNESVLINIASEAFRDDTLGTSVGISMFPVTP